MTTSTSVPTLEKIDPKTIQLFRVPHSLEDIRAKRQAEYQEYRQRLQEIENYTADIGEDWSILRIARERPPPGWKEVFAEADDELCHISQVLEEQEARKGQILPQKKDIFRAFYMTPLEKARVILVGQDPYPQTLPNGLPRATGMSFSLRPYDTITVSLRNIYKELANQFPEFQKPTHGDLSYWASQGVLLLNMSLSLFPSMSNSHRGLWQGFQSIVISHIHKKFDKTVVYILWGREAQVMKDLIPKKATFLESPHPASRNPKAPFFGHSHFRKANWYLHEKGYEIIDWQIPPQV